MAGKITALEVQKKNPDRVSVYVDGRFALGLPAMTAARLAQGQMLSDADIEALQEDGAVETLYHKTLDYLSYRPRSQAEVEDYLRRRGTPDAQIETVVERLKRAGLLDDEAFARYWVENREHFRPRGLRALRYELRNKGIGDETIEQTLASLDSSESAYRSLEKKAHQWSHLDQQTFYRKTVEYLARRGFEYEVAREAAERHWRELVPEE
jgi:regulatory protein